MAGVADQVTYYAVAAQVIPVLALVLAVEMRVFDLRVVPAGKHDSAATPRIFAFVAMVVIGTVIALGEIAALQVLFTNQPSDAAAALVRRGLAFAGTLFGVMQLMLLRRLIDPLTKRQQGLAVGLAVLLAILNVWPAWAALV